MWHFGLGTETSETKTRQGKLEHHEYRLNYVHSSTLSLPFAGSLDHLAPANTIDVKLDYFYPQLMQR